MEPEDAFSGSPESDQWDERGFKRLFPLLFCQETTTENNSELPGTYERLNTNRNGLKLSAVEEENQTISDRGLNLSTGHILRVAGEWFIRFRTNMANDSISNPIHPCGPSISGLSMDNAKDVELVKLLLVAADYTGNQQYEIARKFITHCLRVASSSGTPVQRIVFYFAEGLMLKVGRETDRTNEEAEKKDTFKGLALNHDNRLSACHQKFPLVKIMQIAAVQAVMESVKEGRKIHVIDLQIRSGNQWTALMQGLVDHGIERLKVTAVGTYDKSYMEETGNRLVSIAESLSLPFCFDVVHLQDMNDFKVDRVCIEADETVVIYAFVTLRSMLSRPECLENVMKEIRKLEPDIMVVVEVEVNHNSPCFVGRFVESLFFYAALFDCLKDCMGEDCPCRTVIEAEYFGKGMRNIVAAEGQERVARNVKIEVWRAFLARYGMEEIEVSELVKYQASLVLEKFENGSSWHLENNGKGLIVGWKGTPLHSLTIWKFS